MKFALVTNLAGVGLQVDAELVRDVLVEWGHEVTLHQFDEPWGDAKPDVIILFEVVVANLAGVAPHIWYVANPEWLKPEYVRFVQRHCTKVFAKTREAESVLRDKFSNVHYVGFLTRDRRDTAVERERRFLHVGGNSGYRNTNSVIAAWREYRYWASLDAANAPLTVVTNSTTTLTSDDETIPGVTLLKRVSDDEVTRLQNSHLFHLYPSAYEGFGQALHEAQSVGAIILTTDAPPMNEFRAHFHVPSVRTKRVNFGTLHSVSPADIRYQVTEMLAQPNHVVARMSVESRLLFEKGNREFRATFRGHVEGVAPRISVDLARPKLAILGNFRPQHSTENELLWTLRELDYQVISFQEDEDTTDQILAECVQQEVKLLIYVHTHGWITPGKATLDEMLVALRSAGIKSASFHLDRYAGLNLADGRESRVGTHPFWRTDTVFTADGGNQEFFRARGVNHVWLPPGVVKRDCYLGTARPDLTVDVGFVGAVGYHPEYPFRGELIEFLKGAYGDRFRTFQGYRGEALNDLYASIRVVVGDSCFGGADNYWSDRVPETLGRGGFLIHPASVGLNIPGLATFEPGNLIELQDKIDFALEQPWVRKNCREVAMSWVTSQETYHNRMLQLLRVCGL